MILGAGLGTRLRPLTEWCAKPMVPVGDRPAVAHVLARVRLASPPRVVVNVHHRPDDLRAFADEERVLVSVERELLGTAGGLARARALLGEGDVLVHNGDILCDLDPRALLAAHAEAGAVATLAVTERAPGEGTIGVDAAGFVVRMRGQRFGDEARGGDFLGVHVVGARLRAELPERGCLVGDVYLPALARGARVATHAVSSGFVDVGTVASYVAANHAWLAARGLTSWRAPDAEVGAPVEGSVVGARARVLAPARRSVVWPFAVVREPVDGAVVTPHGIVRP